MGFQDSSERNKFRPPTPQWKRCVTPPPTPPQERNTSCSGRKSCSSSFTFQYLPKHDWHFPNTHKHYLLKEIGVPSLNCQWVLSLNRGQPEWNPAHAADSEQCHSHLRVCSHLQLKASSVQTERPVLYTQEYRGIFCKGSLQLRAQGIFLPCSKLRHDPAKCVFWIWGGSQFKHCKLKGRKRSQLHIRFCVPNLTI